jgi:hypothetical protein
MARSAAGGAMIWNAGLSRSSLTSCTLPLARALAGGAGTRLPADERRLQALAHSVLAAAEHRLEFTALGLAQFNPVAYVHLDLFREKGPDELKVRRMSSPGISFTDKQSEYFGLDRSLHARQRLSCSRGGHAAPLSREPSVGSPHDAHP